MRNKLKPEEQEQIALLEWARLHHDIWPYLIHIRNEGKRSIYEGAKAKRMGLMKGVSDLFLAKTCYIEINGHDSSGLWIELKSSKGKLRNVQRDFLIRMRNEGYKAITAYSWQEAAKAICDYLGKPYNGL